MTAPVSVGLARVTVATPKRRLDVALPEMVPLGELLPHLLRHAGEGLADEGEPNGGWALRRSTGGVLDAKRSLAMQSVRDGEVLHLVPRRVEWPELAYDDIVEIIASGSRRAERSWGTPVTRRCALAAVGALLGLAGTEPAGAAAVALTVAIVLLPGYPLLSAWLGRLPMPELPERAEEMLQDRPTPRRAAVFAATARSHQLLTGLLLAASVVTIVCTAILLAHPSAWGVVLSAVGAAAVLLRA